MNGSIGIEAFDYQAAIQRNGTFLAAYLKSSFGLNDTTFDDPEVAAKLMHGFVKDSVAAMGEVKRLYIVLDGQKRRHLPLPGSPGAPVKCTSCSLHGAEVLWPCEPYTTADKALPEGWPL